MFPSVHIDCHVYDICIDFSSVFDLVPCHLRLFILSLLLTVTQMVLLIDCVFV